MTLSTLPRRVSKAVAAAGLALGLMISGPSPAMADTQPPLWTESSMDMDGFREIARDGYPISAKNEYDPLGKIPFINADVPWTQQTAIGMTLVRWSDGLSVPAIHVQWRTTKDAARGLANTSIRLEAIAADTGETYFSSTSGVHEGFANERNLFVISCARFRAGEITATLLESGQPTPYTVSIPVYPS